MEMYYMLCWDQGYFMLLEYSQENEGYFEEEKKSLYFW